MKANTTSSELKVNEIVNETEKAICVNIAVSWGEGAWRQKDVWFPKSTVEVVEVNGETHIVVADWMLQKTAEKNAIHGYKMNFKTLFNGRNQDDLKAYVVDLTCNCNCFEGTEFECLKEIEDLVINYGHDRNRYAISYTRFD